MRWLVLVVCVAACGRRDFNELNDGVVADAIADHFQVAPGWQLSVLVDFSGVVPYEPNDFMDGTNEVLDNGPVAIAALYPPFTAELVVSCGRSLVEVNADKTTAVHDYRPAVPDTTGPDEIYRMSFGAPSDTGAQLFVASASQGQGDGLFTISPSWQLVRDNTNNNAGGVTYDPTGAFDSIGVPTIYFIDSNGIERRTAAMAQTNIYLNTSNTYDNLVFSDTALFLVDDPTTASLDRVFATTHVLQVIATSSAFTTFEGGSPSSTSIAAIRDSATFAIYANDGTFIDIASSTDPAWVWVQGSAPQAPNALANSYVVIESNRTLDRDRLLVITPE